MADDNDKTVPFPQNPTEKVFTIDGYQRAIGGFQPSDLNEGWQHAERGYKPTITSGQGQSSPPQGGSGVPPKSQPASDVSQSQSGDKK